MIATHKFNGYRRWAQQIDRAAWAYKATFGQFPNIMSVSPVTRRRLSVAAAGFSEAPTYEPMDEFRTSDFEVVLVEEAERADGTFTLIYGAGSLEDLAESLTPV